MWQAIRSFFGRAVVAANLVDPWRDASSFYVSAYRDTLEDVASKLGMSIRFDPHVGCVEIYGKGKETIQVVGEGECCCSTHVIVAPDSLSEEVKNLFKILPVRSFEAKLR